MIRAFLLCGLTLLGGCTATGFGKPCDLDAASQEQALQNIAVALKSISYIRPEQYLNDDFHAQGTFNGKEHCSFLIRPWQPITSERIWDGTFSFRVNKQTLEVEKYLQVDEG